MRETVIEVARDYTCPEIRRFMVAGEAGPQTPGVFGAFYAIQHGYDMCARTQNDCWHIFGQFAEYDMGSLGLQANRFASCLSRLRAAVRRE